MYADYGTIFISYCIVLIRLLNILIFPGSLDTCVLLCCCIVIAALVGSGFRVCSSQQIISSLFYLNFKVKSTTKILPDCWLPQPLWSGKWTWLEVLDFPKKRIGDPGIKQAQTLKFCWARRRIKLPVNFCSCALFSNNFVFFNNNYCLQNHHLFQAEQVSMWPLW